MPREAAARSGTSRPPGRGQGSGRSRWLVGGGRRGVTGMSVWLRRMIQLGSVLLLLLAWDTVARLEWVDSLFIPAPSAVALALTAIGPEAFRLLGETLGKALIAYTLSVVLGVGAGLVIGAVRYLYDVLNPFVIAVYAIPKILVLP